MKKAHSSTSLSNVHSETQKLLRQNANVLRSRRVRCLLSHVIVEFPNSRHMYALRTYFWEVPKGRYVSQKQVQKSDRINSDHQSGSDQLGSSWIMKKHKIKWNWNFYPFEISCLTYFEMQIKWRVSNFLSQPEFQCVYTK